MALIFTSAQYGELYGKCFSMVRAYLRKTTGNDDAAEDIFQDSLVTAIEISKRDKFELTSGLSTFVYGIAINKCHEMLKGERKMKSVVSDEYGDYADEDAESERKEWMVEILKKCLEKLTITKRKIIMAVYYEKMKMVEIATAFSLENADSAKAQKYKAVKDLQECFKLNENNYRHGI